VAAIQNFLGIYKSRPKEAFQISCFEKLQGSGETKSTATQYLELCKNRTGEKRTHIWFLRESLISETIGFFNKTDSAYEIPPDYGWHDGIHVKLSDLLVLYLPGWSAA
jgi:hypothetical protein